MKNEKILTCDVSKKCGGCQYQGTPYQEQLKTKQKNVEKLLKGFGKVEPVAGMENPYYYRNKVHAVFGRERNGKIISGTYQANTHKIVNIDNCLIEDQKSGEIIRTIRDLLKSFKIKTYDEDTRYGLLRHVLVRRGFVSGQIMVVLVLSCPILPSKNNFVKALRKVHPEITTVVLNVNDKKTNMILGDRDIVLYGKGYIEDTLCGCTFRISPRSFYQVNPVQTEVLYGKAIEYAELSGKEKVIDAYCGIGTIGLIASKKAKEVIGVELNPNAIRDAKINAKQNNITNVQFYQADAGEFMVSLARQGVSADVVFMDPPRAGSDEAFLSSVVKLAPEKVVYVSCNPETLARDLKYLTGHGYQVKKMQPVDMFCFTQHVECVTLLQKSNRKCKPDSYVKLSLDMEDYYRIKDAEGDVKIE
ncbi:MAG: 23S rRNA (uracil(1939)-C(5))-methyltransferase RlmD [Eubacteriales bacterium]|nr:23S rRNA (uracil(1939)-C(5))-methyltransferase RlmD [Eubacteriales bacterium]